MLFLFFLVICVGGGAVGCGNGGFRLDSFVFWDDNLDVWGSFTLLMFVGFYS